MIIGFEAKRAFKNNTGLGNYSRMLICGLAHQHQEVRSILYSPDMSGEYRSYFSGYANISTHQPSGLDRKLPNLWRRYGVSMHLKSDKVDLFHGLSHELPHGIPHSIKRVVTMHDLIVWRFPQYYKPFDRMVHRAKQRHSCRIADAVVAISQSTKNDVVRFLHIPEEKIHVVYQSCDPIFWQPVDETTKVQVRKRYQLPDRYLVCVGSIEERKNQATVVKALAQLPDDIHLVIVGRAHGRYLSEVQSQVRALKLSSRVHILSDADFDDFPALYANALASVYLSLFEGFGIPILESMCCDIPVLTSNVSSMPEAGGDAALYASPDCPDEVAAQLKRLVESPQLRQELIAKGRQQRQRFTREKVVEDLWRVYASLVPPTEDDLFAV